jgi:ADP-ribose pyrophosphatase
VRNTPRRLPPRECVELHTPPQRADFDLRGSVQKKAQTPARRGVGTVGGVTEMSGAAAAGEPAQWTILGEREVDATRRLRLSIAEVQLPDGVRFEQYVLRIPAAAMAVVVDDQLQVLMLRRHRFILDRSVWELPGGYLDEGEEPAACAAREAEEETGWRPAVVEHLVTFQPMVGSADAPNHLFLGREAVYVGVPDVNEPGEVAWIPLADAGKLIAEGSVVGAASVIGLMAARERLGVR